MLTPEKYPDCLVCSKRSRGVRNPCRCRCGGRRRGDVWPSRWIAFVLVATVLVLLLAGCERRQSRPRSSNRTAVAPSRQTVTLPPTSTATPSTAGLPESGAMPLASPAPEVYAVHEGDTLSSIAQRFGCDLDELVEANKIDDPSLLRVGQKLQLSVCQLDATPAITLLPNSEFVDGPAYVDFDIGSFVAAQGGYLSEYHESVGGEVLSGSEIVSLIVRRYSVGPRMLLAVLETKGGWVTDPSPTGDDRDFPMGYRGGGWNTLYWQLAWAADELNRGYYDWRGRGMTPIVWNDGSVMRYDPSLNAATAALQRFFSLRASENKWEKLVGEGPGGFADTYRRLFGDPAQYAIEPLIPVDTTQPPLALPWPKDELWFYTSGPHGGWEEGSAWAALDFAPNERGLGCRRASSLATAAAAGLVLHSEDGEVLIDLDGDGHQETGWVLFYLHVATRDRVPVGTRLEQGDPVGHPSCEGGLSEATHLNIARRFNGEWIAVDGPLPFVMSGWQFHSSGNSYDGSATRGEEERTACECWEADYNGLVADR
jgi:LasA protease